MRDHLTADNLSSPARRHFLHVLKAVASVAAVPALSTSASAQALSPSVSRLPPRNAGCFLKGVQILTRDGLKRVETLSIGDHVMTARGETMPIRWIGRQIFRRGVSSRWPIVSTPFALRGRRLPTMFLTRISISHRCMRSSLMVCLSKWPHSSTVLRSFLPRRKA
jgi:hypothetical protein